MNKQVFILIILKEKEMQIQRRESTQRSVVNNLALAHIGYSVPTRPSFIIFLFHGEIGSLSLSLFRCSISFVSFLGRHFKSKCVPCVVKMGVQTQCEGSFFIAALPIVTEI